MAEADMFSADDELALAIARGVSVAEAAKLVEMSERTAYRRMADPKFRSLVLSIRGLVFDRAVGRLIEVSNRAVQGLVEFIDGDCPAAQKLAACRAILEFSAKFRQEAELEERLKKLEERFDAPNSSTTAAA